MVGDSAGGNLIVSVSLRLVELGAKRLPDGLVPIYTPFLFQAIRTRQNYSLFIFQFLVFAIAFSCSQFHGSPFAHGRCHPLRSGSIKLEIK
jgi:acetyl esterase/lipase